MKTIYAFSLILPLFGSMLCTRSKGSNQKPEGVPESYTYYYNTTMAYPVTYFQVERDSTGAVRLAWLKYGPDVTVIKAPEDVLEKIGEIAQKFNLHQLKDSYYPSMEVLDGNSWHLYLRYSKGSVSSGGNNAWPSEKLKEGIDSINAYLQSIVDASSEEDILSTEDYREYKNNR